MYMMERDNYARYGLYGQAHVDIFAYQGDQQVGHFTQIVWQDTKEVGCAYNPCPNLDTIICNFYPAGNYKNEFALKVSPPN